MTHQAFDQAIQPAFDESGRLTNYGLHQLDPQLKLNLCCFLIRQKRSVPIALVNEEDPRLMYRLLVNKYIRKGNVVCTIPAYVTTT